MEIYYLLFYAVYGFLKSKMIAMDSRQSTALFLCLKNLVVAFIQTFQCSFNKLFK